jgi:hypothetical protein
MAQLPFFPRQDVLSRRANTCDLLQKLGRFDRCLTLEAALIMKCDALTFRERDILASRRVVERDFEAILSELEKVTETLNHPSKKHPVKKRESVENLIEKVAVKPISFRFINHLLFRNMIQLVNPDFCAPVYNTSRPHNGHVADLYRQLSEREKKVTDL